VDVVSNGQSAIDALVAKPYDIVLMDCQMPVLDGYDATRQLRLLEKQGGLAAKEVRLPIIALTASAIQGDRQRCLEAGMDRYVTKPIDSNELIGAIKSLLGRTSTVDQNAPCRSRNGESALPIDIGGLVDRCMGDVTLVDEVLNLFALELPKQVKRLTDGLRNQDRAEISNLVHEFKGVAANLSARFLTSRIDELEALIQENGWDSAMAAMGAVEKAVQSCIDFIPQALECVRQPQSKITIA
jgi:Amt family ammonium transporter